MNVGNVSFSPLGTQCACSCHYLQINQPCWCDCKWKHLTNSYITSDDPQTQLNALKMRINAQEHTINEMQKTIEKCIFEGDKTHLSIIKLETKMTELEKFMKVKMEKLMENDSCIYWGYKEIKGKTKEKPENIFDFVKCDNKGIDDIRHIKNAMYELYCWILDNVPENKYRSNGIDLLEAAAMQLNKAISRRKDNGTQKS